MRGRKNHEIPSTNNILPPCRVCGEPGTGFHYGVTTCGACKGFFRRSLTREDPYVCIQSQLCKVGPSTNRRQSCPKCRYDKCIAVGMSKEACKVGRYSLLKKSKDIEEARGQTQPSPNLSPQASPHLPPQTSPNQPPQTSPNQPPQTSPNLPPQASPNLPPQASSNLPHAFVHEDASGWQYDNSKTATGMPSTSDNFVDSLMEKDYDRSKNSFNDLMTDQYVPSRFTEDENVLYFQEHHTFHSKGGSDKFINPFCDNLEDYEGDQNVNRCDENSFAVDIGSDVTDKCADDLWKEVNDNDYCIVDTLTQTDHSVDHRETSYTILKSITRCHEVSSSNHASGDQTNYLTSPSPIVFKEEDNYDVRCSPQSDSMNMMSVSPWNNSVQSPNSISTTVVYNLPLEQHSQSQLFNKSNHRPFNVTRHIQEQENSSSDIDCDVSSNEFSSPICSRTDEYVPYNCTYSNDMIASDHSSEPTEINLSATQNKVSPYTHPYIGNMMFAERTRTSIPGSNIPGRLFRETDEGSKATTKRKRFSEIMDPDSGRESTPEKSMDLVPVFKHKNDKASKPITLCIVAPDPLKYTLSIFEQFPFKSFETKTLAPLLKMCYYTEDYEFRPLPMAQKSAIQCIGYHVQQPPTFNINSLLTSENSLEFPTFGQEYDTEEMDKLYDYLQVIHCRYYGPESSFLTPSEREMFMEMFHKICQLHDSLQGKLNLIDDDKYFNILQTTGIDVDKRKEWFNCTFDQFDASFTRDTKFFRALPGFADFSLKDRINLTKSTALIHKGLRHYQIIDIEHDVCIDPDVGVAARVTAYFQVLPGLLHIHDKWRVIVHAVKELEPSFNELIVLKAAFAFFPDFCEELDDREIITKWHNVYLNCLKHVVRKYEGPNADARYNRIIGIIQLIKEMEEKWKKTRSSLKNTICLLSSAEEQPLLKEVFVNLPC